MNRFIFAFAALAGSTICSMPIGAHAQQQQPFPSRIVNFVVPSTPGSGTDLLGRQMADRLTKIWGVPVVVINKPGADTVIASRYVVEQPADGYTLYITNSSTLVNHVMAKDPSSAYTNLTPVALVATSPLILSANAKTPFSDVKGMLDYSAKNPGKMNYSASVLSIQIATELFKLITNLDATHIPYPGGTEAALAVVTGETDISFSTLLPSLPYIQGGQTKAIGLAAPARAAMVPDVPTFREQGVDFTNGAWFINFVSAKTPPAILSKIDADMQAVRKDPTFQKFVDGQGAIPSIGDRKEVQAFLENEEKNLQKIMASGRIK